MELHFKIYMAAWLSACVVAATALVRLRAEIELFQSAYWVMLTQPWKVLTFLVASSGLTMMAPYTGDPTWDYVDAAFMSVLTYLTAPWTIGIFFRAWRYRAGWRKVLIALCVAMFSASWSYDGYLVWRDGEYPFTWLPNIFASGVLYVCAGLFWSLEWRAGYGVHFGFTQADWPATSQRDAFAKVFWIALPFMILVAAMVLPFIL